MRDEVRELRGATLPELDAEQEVDLRRYATAIAARWWLLLAGVVAGVVVGYLVSISGGDVYRAQALMYIGQALAPGGNSPVLTLNTNPFTVREIATSERVIKRVAASSGMSAKTLRSGITVQVAAGQTERTTGAVLMNLAVRGEGPGKVADAANQLARICIGRLSTYVNQKIEGLDVQIEALRREVESLDRRIDTAAASANDPGLTPTEKLVAITNAGLLEQRRSIAQQQLSDRQQLLFLAQSVEKSRILEAAVARKVTAESERNSIVVGAVLGLIAGLLAALLWDPIAVRLSRRPR